jgi:hypothetical protein
MRNRKAHPRINVWARLQPGATLAEAEAELALIGHHLAEQYPESNAGRSFVAEPLRPDVGDVRSTLFLLMGVASLVLLIACVNVASQLQVVQEGTVNTAQLLENLMSRRHGVTPPADARHQTLARDGSSGD